MNRYLVRRSTGEVFAYTELLAKRGDLDEVYAENPAEAVEKEPVLDPRKVSIADIEKLPKADLIVFARAKLGVEIDDSLERTEIEDKVKEALLLAPSRGAMPVAKEVGPFSDAKSAMKAPGDRVPPKPKKSA